ncbi:hypothetical protein J6W34_00300 [bacterium]|nr:hypothetical protein [bacterium]
MAVYYKGYKITKRDGKFYTKYKAPHIPSYNNGFYYYQFIKQSIELDISFSKEV